MERSRNRRAGSKGAGVEDWGEVQAASARGGPDIPSKQ
jgi:hypothetical protein